MNYKYIGGNNNLFILFHQTGGNVNSLINLAKSIDQNAAILSIEGHILENGKKRYFKRKNNQILEESLLVESKKIVEKLKVIIKELKLTNKDITLIGYSNGANLISGIIYKQLFKMKNAIILHGIKPFKNETLKKQNINIFLSYSFNDIFVKYSDFNNLKKDFITNVYKTKVYIGKSGHQINNDEINSIKKWFDNI